MPTDARGLPEPDGTGSGGAPAPERSPSPGGAPPGSQLVPPRDAEEWSDEQWLAFLAQGEDEEDADAADGGDNGGPGRLQRSAGGRLLGNAMLGVAEAFGQKRPEVVVEAEAPGDPFDDDLVVWLDPERPERSTVRRRRGPRRGPGASGSDSGPAGPEVGASGSDDSRSGSEGDPARSEGGASGSDDGRSGSGGDAPGPAAGSSDSGSSEDDRSTR